MPDVVDPATRSRMMAGIRGKDTKPELLIRRGLHKLGYRFRLHDPNLGGRPDLVLKKYNAVIFIHGCFWHGHECSLFKWPETKRDFWFVKINANRERDNRQQSDLLTAGWRVGIVWECSLRGRRRHTFEDVLLTCSEWLKSDAPWLELSELDEKNT